MVDVHQLDEEIQRRHLLKHPFYVAWADGTVPRSALREYAKQYYRFEVNFPRYVAAAYARLEDPADRRVLLDNLIDEEGRARTHPDLWLDFAAAVGVPRAGTVDAPPWTATRSLCRTYERLTGNGSASSALAALYAYESIFPEVAAEKSRGLKERYGIRARRAHEFFRIHTFADVEHARAEAAILNRYMARSATDARRAVRSTHDTIHAWWRFLDQFGC